MAVKISKTKMIEKLENRLNSLLLENLNLKTLAYTDRLTGCYNQNFLYDKEFIQKRLINSSNEILYYIDLDNLKEINDTLGHKEGDNYIKSFARGMSCYGELFRIGGDEFILITSNYLPIQELSKRFKFSYGDEPLYEADFEEIIQRAERKMMARKRMKKES